MYLKFPQADCSPKKKKMGHFAMFLGHFNFYFDVVYFDKVVKLFICILISLHIKRIE